MTIYDYLMETSCSSLAKGLPKIIGWTSWRCFPASAKEFCNVMNLEEDDRITSWYIISRGSYVEVYITILIDNHLYKDFTYNIGFLVSGYKKPQVDRYKWGGFHHTVELYFKDKFNPAIKNPQWHNCLKYDLTNDAIFNVDDVNRSTQVKYVIDAVTAKFNELTCCIEKVIDSFYNGEYETALKKYIPSGDIKPGYYASDGFMTPNFCALINVLYLAKKIANAELSVTDAAVLLINRIEYNINPAFDFLGDWSFWHRGATKKAEEVVISEAELRSLIEESYKVLGAGKDEYTVFSAAVNDANKFINSKLREVLTEAEKQYGVKSEYLMLHGFAKEDSWKTFDPAKNNIKKCPDKWRYDGKN